MILADYLSLNLTVEAEYLLALLLLRENTDWSALQCLSFFDEVPLNGIRSKVLALECQLSRRLAWETLRSYCLSDDEECSNALC